MINVEKDGNELKITFNYSIDKGYSNKTIKYYLGHVRRFQEFINMKLSDINTADIKSYI